MLGRIKYYNYENKNGVILYDGNEFFFVYEKEKEKKQAPYFITNDYVEFSTSKKKNGTIYATNVKLTKSANNIVINDYLTRVIMEQNAYLLFNQLNKQHIADKIGYHNDKLTTAYNLHQLWLINKLNPLFLNKNLIFEATCGLLIDHLDSQINKTKKNLTQEDFKTIFKNIFPIQENRTKNLQKWNSISKRANYILTDFNPKYICIQSSLDKKRICIILNFEQVKLITSLPTPIEILPNDPLNTVKVKAYHYSIIEVDSIIDFVNLNSNLILDLDNVIKMLFSIKNKN